MAFGDARQLLQATRPARFGIAAASKLERMREAAVEEGRGF